MYDRIPRGASPAARTILPSLDPVAVAQAGEASRAAVEAQSANYQQILYQQALDQQRAQLAQQIQQSRATATLETSYTPNPRAAAAPRINVPSSVPTITAAAAFGIANTALTALSLQQLADQAEGFVLDRSSHLPQPVRDWLRWSRSNNPFDPGNFLHYASDRLFDRLYDWAFPNHARSRDALTGTHPLETPPPFYGGQEVGRLYNVSASVTFIVSDAYGNPVPRTDLYNWQVPGPISGFVKSVTGTSPNQSEVIHFVAGSGSAFVGSFGIDPETGSSSLQSYTINNVSPVDGLPDTGGNPAPAPGTPRPEGQRASNISPGRNIAPVIAPPRLVPNNPTPAATPRSIPKPTPALVPTAASPSSPIHPKNLSPGKAPNPFKSLPDSQPNPVAPAGNAELAPAVTAATAPAPLTRPVTPTTIAGGGMQPNETAQDYIERLHNEQMQRFRDAANLGFTNPFENLSNDITERNPSTATATPTLNPLIPALGVAGLVGAGAVIATRTIPSGLQTSNPTRTGNPRAPVTARPVQTQTQLTPQTPEFPGTGTGTPTNFCSYDSRNISGKVDQTNATLNSIQVVLQQQVLSTVNSIDSKMGSTALTGGVTGALSTIGNTVQTIQNFSKRTWDFLQVDRILSLLTWIGVMHNAYMLSSALTQTLFSAISSALDATGLDEFFKLVKSDDEEVDVGGLVGKMTDSFFKSIFGVESVDGFKQNWKKWNRIYQAASNIIYSVQSMIASMVEILEVISNYTGKIGNALLKSGTVLQNSFNWMNPNMNYQNSKWFRYMNAIQETLELFDEAAQEVVSIQETGAELANQITEMNKELSKGEKEVEDKQNAGKNASTPNVTISNSDERSNKQ